MICQPLRPSARPCAAATVAQRLEHRTLTRFPGPANRLRPSRNARGAISGATWPIDHSQYGLLRSRSTGRTAKELHALSPSGLRLALASHWGDQLVVGIVNGFASRGVFGIIESDRPALFFLFERDLRANAFRVCREGKPLSTFPVHALASCETSARRRSCRSPCARRAWRGLPD